MTISALHLGNFKAFADTQEAPLRPLTLLYGPNSAGKSSLIHSLALALAARSRLLNAAEAFVRKGWTT